MTVIVRQQDISQLPVIKPVLALLRSRKFIVAVVTFLVSILIVRVPELAVMRSELLTIVTALALTVIGGTAIEDAAAAGRDAAAQPPRPIGDLAKEVVNTAIDVTLNPEQPEASIQVVSGTVEVQPQNVRKIDAAHGDTGAFERPSPDDDGTSSGKIVG